MDSLFAPAALSVSELNACAKELLDNQLSGFWISGEVSNFSRAASGHCYFVLKDDHAQVRCTLFKFAAARLSTPLQDGSQIEVCGKVGIYEARGEFQINVNEVRQTGLGRLFERYEQLKKQLQGEGLFDPERKRTLPERPRAIGIVTSLAAAALRDVVSTLKRRAPDIPLIVYPTPVQGSGSEQQIADAIRAAVKHAQVDVLIVCRGGGSIEDLWAFNEEAVVRAVAECPLPLVSGVGHETDFTLCDFAADLRAPTPTAAAELVSPNLQERLQHLRHLRFRLQQLLLQHHQNAAQKTDRLAAKLLHPRQQLSAQQQTLQRHSSSLRQAFAYRLGTLQQRFLRQQEQLQLLQPNTAHARSSLQQLHTRLHQQRQHLLAHKQQCLQQQSSLLEAVSPQHILARGFAVVRNSRGQVIRDADTLKQGQKLHIIFAEGETDVRVTAEQQQPDLFDYS